jgi:hypothetical protein
VGRPQRYLSGAEVSLRGSRVQRLKPPNPIVREGSLQQTNARPDHTLGQSRHFDRAPFTSGLSRLADILRVIRHVAKVPKPEVVVV